MLNAEKEYWQSRAEIAENAMASLLERSPHPTPHEIAAQIQNDVTMAAMFRADSLEAHIAIWKGMLDQAAINDKLDIDIVNNVSRDMSLILRRFQNDE